MNQKQHNIIGIFLFLAFSAWVTPAMAADPDLIDVIEIVGTNPFIVHTNILPGDSFMDTMTVNNLTGSPQTIVMGLDIDLSQGIFTPPHELEEKIAVRIERVGSGDLILPGPGNDAVATLQELDDTVIELGTIAGSASQIYKIHALFDPNAGNEYQNTKVYFNIAMSVDVPDIQESLLISKVNDSTSDEVPGNEVEYKLMVTALHGDVDAVTVTDLPPEGFEYIAGSGSGAPFVHEYASPGVWDLGDMAEGETKTLTYRTRISPTQDAGLYRDLAFARGMAGDTSILANGAENPFVGTQVNVVLNDAPTVVVEEDNENKQVEKIKKKTKYVLGAATLPLTGANMDFLVLALVLFFGGLGFILVGKRRKQPTHSATNTLMKSFLFILLVGASFLSAQVATAAPLAVQIETPDTIVNNPNFKIGFVALDIKESRPVRVECYETTYGLFETYNLATGGGSGDCQVTAIILPVDGDYSFHVKAIATDEGSEIVTSETVSVELATSAPGTPYDYRRDDSSCLNNISFKTAADGGKTVKVELYRSLSKSFMADASTFVAEQTIGSDVSGTFAIVAPSCSNDYFYALRALETHGNGSSFVGDKDVDVNTYTVTRTRTTAVTLPGTTAGAIPVTAAGGGAPIEGTVEGATTTNEEAVDGGSDRAAGSVLGEATEETVETAGSWLDWAKTHLWWSLFVLLALGALGYSGYGMYQEKKRHDESIQ